MDFQKPYIECWLRFIGFTDLRPVVVEPTLGAPEQAARARTQAREAAATVGAVWPSSI